MEFLKNPMFFLHFKWAFNNFVILGISCVSLYLITVISKLVSSSLWHEVLGLFGCLPMPTFPNRMTIKLVHDVGILADEQKLRQNIGKLPAACMGDVSMIGLLQWLL
jgi:hypothetical protein